MSLGQSDTTPADMTPHWRKDWWLASVINLNTVTNPATWQRVSTYLITQSVLIKSTQIKDYVLQL